MLKKNIFIFVLLFPITAFVVNTSQIKSSLAFGDAIYGQNLRSNTSQSNDFVSEFLKLPLQQLSDTGDYYLLKNSYDTALICYNLFINATLDDDIEQQRKEAEAYNKCAVIYYYMCDYRMAYDFAIKALLCCEKSNYISYQAKVYSNIGMIYYQFGNRDLSKFYYSTALKFPQDTTSIVALLNNLGAIELKAGSMDSSAYFLTKALQISKRHDDFLIYRIWNNMASLYHQRQIYDTALYYYHASLNMAKSINQVEVEAENLSDLSKLFFEINKTDSALYYIALSNTVAEKNNFLRILAENYLTLSKIEEAKGNATQALAHYKQYANLMDSIFNVEKFGEISQMQRLYEVSKTNQQIEELIIEKQIKERTIKYQKRIQFILISIILVVSLLLYFINLQKRNLGKAYKSLFEKNMQIIELQENPLEKQAEKYKRSTLKDEMQDELLKRILTIMEDTTIICDTEFSLDRLTELVESNQTYVSQAINSAFEKNFRSFLNEYRIREAQRLFSEIDLTKYTIASIAQRVGYKSPTTFRNIFKEITGITPNYYFKSLQGL